MRNINFYPNGDYHICNRGNRKKPIFLEESDYEVFLYMSHKYCELLEIELSTYSLIKNHYHFMLKQLNNKTISMMMHRLGIAYTLYFNRKYDLVGHLFQGKFKSREINGEEDFLNTMEYIIFNPVKDGLVKYWQDYKWTWTRYY